jgi:demethylmenaquinone methyltransferase / 2-methoxy-6-polyprenyl-1,4-benzoquinol methylase
MTAAAQDALISAQENRRMFDQIARRYDLLNALMSLGLHRLWRRRATRCALAQGGRDYLDIGSGTGDLALDLLRRSPDARIVGIDPSSAMRALAVEKTSAAGLQGRATYLDGDAVALPMPAGSFDGVLCAFCLRNIVDHAAALREMRRVLRPGGTAAILELTRPRAAVPAFVHRLYVRRVIPLVGRLLSQGNAYRYLADSIDNFPPAQQVIQALAAAGFVEARGEPLTGGFVTLFTGRAPGNGAPGAT